ncbi:hypothetical protein ES705_35017 [subsurface metagenome]
MIIKPSGSFSTRKKLTVIPAPSCSSFRIVCSDFYPGIQYIELTINELKQINKQVRDFPKYKLNKLINSCGIFPNKMKG